MKNHSIIKTIFALLFFNNLIGIVLNLRLTISSAMFGLGLPVVVIFFINFYWYIKKPILSNSVILYYSILTGLYNVWIFLILNTFSRYFDSNKIFESFYPIVFPSINICLYTLLFISSIVLRNKSWKQTNKINFL